MDNIIASSVVRKEVKKVKKKRSIFWKNVDRKILFLIITALRWPILFCLSIFRFFFQYIFLVYPGTDKDLDGFCWRRLAKSRLFSARPSIGGIITKSKGGVRGIYFVVPNTVKEFVTDKIVCENIARRLRLYRVLVGAKSIALAGQAPGIYQRNTVSMQRPFVDGVKGTVFCIMDTIAEAKKIHGLHTGSFNIAVVGVGHVGSKLLEALRAEGERVYGIDIVRKTQGGVILPNSGKLILGSAEVVVVLTPKGSDFEAYTPYLRENSIVIDDTHPMISKKPEGVKFYKVAMNLPGAKFLPNLPDYKADWIPGCAVQAIYSAQTGDFNGTSQSEFNRRCRELGFRPYMGE